MKKSLIALAVLATAGMAAAQSSVTLFGIVDTTIAHGRGNGVGSSDKTQLTSGGYAASRLGFRGSMPDEAEKWQKKWSDLFIKK